MRLATQSAAGTALTNSVSETRLAVYTLPANAAAVEKEYQVFACVRATATNATDTLQVKFRVGGTTLTGTTVVDATAVDVANNDIVVLNMRGIVRAISATAGIIVWAGSASIEGASGTVTQRSFFTTVSSLNTTAAILFEITGTWSVANAGNSCQSELFDVDEFVIGKG